MSLATNRQSMLPENVDRYNALLHEHFGYPALRPGQQRVLQALAENDVLAVMPTGGGKSLCYVLPALAVGRVLVVSPLIALMHDQVEALSAAGVAAGAINSSISREEQNQFYLDFIRGRLQLLYVAPERFANDRFVNGLREAGVNLLAIDEAHCVSEWGHDFRPDYLMLGHVRQRLGNPRTLALTATAEPRVRKDISERLGITAEGSNIITSVDRPNLTFRVVPVNSDRARKEWLTGYLLSKPRETGVVYARTRKAVEDLAETLRAVGIDAEAYHAGLAANERTAIQRRFTTDQHRVIVATNAFGLGIDKPDVRFVVHANMPGRLESYYQEAGRAGRDGDPAECTLLFHSRDVTAQQYFIDRAHPGDDQVADIWDRLLAPGEEAQPGTERASEDGGAMALAALRAAGLVDVYGKPVRRGTLPQSVSAYVLQHRQHAEERLERMAAYAQSERCRRTTILQYFGEQPEADCGACDNCNGAAGAGPDTLLGDLMALRSRLASKHRREPEEIMDLRTLQDLAEHRPMTESELLETWGIGEVKSRWFGEDLLQVIQDWEMAHPGAPVRPARQQRRLARVLRESPEAPVNDELYSQLVTWRRERAERDNVPAYVVCGNKTLREIAARQPRTERALAGVWGLGESRIERYGDEILQMVNSRR